MSFRFLPGIKTIAMNIGRIICRRSCLKIMMTGVRNNRFLMIWVLKFLNDYGLWFFSPYIKSVWLTSFRTIVELSIETVSYQVLTKKVVAFPEEPFVFGATVRDPWGRFHRWSRIRFLDHCLRDFDWTRTDPELPQSRSWNELFHPRDGNPASSLVGKARLRFCIRNEVVMEAPRRYRMCYIE